MTISFAGHAFICSGNSVKELVKEQIENNIDGEESVVCFLGGYGQFDDICAYACRELKQKYSKIQLVYVTPYMSLSDQIRIIELKKQGMYDEVLYPPIEKVPLKFAISKRNNWMVENSDLVIAYVNHSFGGAYKTLQSAKRKKKRIINICDFV